MNKIRILVVGCGNMGLSHARAYKKIDAFEIVGFVSNDPNKRPWLQEEFPGVSHYTDFYVAIQQTQPAAVSINTYPDTHAKFAIASMQAGADVFLEKPIAQTIEQAEDIFKVAKQTKRKILVGYILRHHPSWIKFIELARDLGRPLVMRMNLNQQSFGQEWEGHKNLLSSLSPLVDCGVHYVDIMCLMTQKKPTSVHTIGAKLSNEINENMYNYGQLQVSFEDGSIGWYEAGWGPMISEVAFFIKDVIGPKGSVSITKNARKDSSNIDSHTKTDGLLVHSSQLNENGQFLKQDVFIDMSNGPDHQSLCDLEQEYFLKAIRENLDLTSHLEDALNSLKIVLAADESIKTDKKVYF
jgi:predicted dehydrogenase